MSRRRSQPTATDAWRRSRSSIPRAWPRPRWSCSSGRRLVVVKLQPGPISDVELDELVARAPRGRAAARHPHPAAPAHHAAAADRRCRARRGQPGLLTSRTTRRAGFVDRDRRAADRARASRPGGPRRASTAARSPSTPPRATTSATCAASTAACASSSRAASRRWRWLLASLAVAGLIGVLARRRRADAARLRDGAAVASTDGAGDRGAGTAAARSSW